MEEGNLEISNFSCRSETGWEGGGKANELASERARAGEQRERGKRGGRKAEKVRGQLKRERKIDGVVHKELIELRTDRQRDRARANVCSAYLRKSLDPLSPFGDLS